MPSFTPHWTAHPETHPPNIPKFEQNADSIGLLKKPRTARPKLS
jgi:hypothetical protein